MGNAQVNASAVIAAPADVVYGIIADYENGHPHILPESLFTSLDVEKGGYGAGSIIRVGVRAGNRTTTMRMEVEEPEPGRVLLERDLDRGTETTFTVEPLADGASSRVTIHTDLRTGGGLQGLFEKLFVPRLLRSAYDKELQKLDKVAQERAAARPTA